MVNVNVGKYTSPMDGMGMITTYMASPLRVGVFEATQAVTVLSPIVGSHLYRLSKRSLT